MDGASGLWYVQLADGDVHRVTLDQLDEGFQAGHIDGETMVLAAGATRWAKLGQLAGIDEVAPIPAAPRVASPARVVPPSVPSLPAARPLHIAPPIGAAPAEPEPSSPRVISLESNRPVSVDLTDLALEAGLPRRSGKRWLAALTGLALICGASTVAVKRPGLAQRVSHYAVAAKSWAAAAVLPRRTAAKEEPPQIALTVAPVVTPPLITATATTTPTTPSADVSANPSPSRGVDEAKPRPHDGEKPPAARTKTRKAHPTTGTSPTAASAAGRTTFTTSGNKFDPLSSSIR
jgi:hypothetical protein